jgi:hypothetical protein
MKRLIYPPQVLISKRGVQLFFLFTSLCGITNPFTILQMNSQDRAEILQKYFLWLLLFRSYTYSTSFSYFSHVTTLISSILDINVQKESFWTPAIIRFSRKNLISRSVPRIRIPWCIFFFLISSGNLDILNKFDDLLYFTILSWSIFGMFRIGELLPRSANALSPLLFSDIHLFSFVNDSLLRISFSDYFQSSSPFTYILLRIHLKHSKTNKLGEFVWISSIPCLGLLCPVQLFLRYTYFRCKFHSPIHYCFSFSSGKAITYSIFNKRTHALLDSVIPPKQHLSLHHTGRGYGFRLLQCCNAPHWLILALGRWLDRNAYLAYAKITIKDIILWQKKLGEQALIESNPFISKLLLHHSISICSIKNTISLLHISHTFLPCSPAKDIIFVETFKPISLIYSDCS